MFLFAEIAFEWFVTVIWERYGPVAGIVAGLAIVGVMIAAVFLTISLWGSVIG